MFNDDIQSAIYTAEPLVPQPSVFEVELAIEELKCQKSSSIDQIPTELISICNKEELPEEWKQSVTVPVYRNVDETDCNNYRGILHYKIISNILLSRLTPYGEEIIGGSSMWISMQKDNY